MVKMIDKTKVLTRGHQYVASVGFVTLLATLMAAPFMAKADGGMILTKDSPGPFVITIFAPAEISRDLPADLTVMVQRRDTDEVVMDAAVDLTFVPPVGRSLKPNESICGPRNSPLDSPGQPSPVRATRSQAANKLLYGASVLFPMAGNWQMQAVVRQGSEVATVACALAIGTSPRRLAGLWPYLALPGFAIVLFGMNLWLRLRSVRALYG
jgi:hypothetical protein